MECAHLQLGTKDTFKLKQVSLQSIAAGKIESESEVLHCTETHRGCPL